jgi:hypothetical protein
MQFFTALPGDLPLRFAQDYYRCSRPGQLVGSSPRSAACPFDGDHATVVLEILSRRKPADLIHEGRKKLFDRKAAKR